MNTLRALADTNPAAIVAVAGAAYGVAWWARRYWQLAVVGVWLAAAVAFLALPSGRATVDAAAAQDGALKRAWCLVSAVRHGAPLSQTAAARTAACRRVDGPGAPSERARQDALRNTNSIKEAVDARR